MGDFLFGVIAMNDVTVLRRGPKIVFRLDSWRARRWFKKHFAGEVVSNRLVIDAGGEQELWDRFYAVADHTELVFCKSP